MNTSIYLKKMRKRTLYILAVVFAVCPPLLLIPMLVSVIKPAIRREIPKGLAYITWVVSLIFWGAIFSLPYGLIGSVNEGFKNIDFAGTFLVIHFITTIVGIFLILRTVKNWIKSNSYIPLRKFKIDGLISVFFLLSFLPILSLKFPNFLETKISHPALASILLGFQLKYYWIVITGFLVVGILGPIFEEFVFRGLLLESSHDLRRSSSLRWILDISVCLFFALLHFPVSFIFPFIFSASAIFIRRKTGSLVLPIIAHIIWNSSTIIVMLVQSVINT